MKSRERKRGKWDRRGSNSVTPGGPWTTLLELAKDSFGKKISLESAPLSSFIVQYMCH